MKIRLIFITFFAFLGLVNAQKSAAKLTKFYPGQIWKDDKNVPINAHGGNVIYHKKKYYWYGESKIPGKSELQRADGGIHCYSSKDLMNWKDEGLVLPVSFTDTTIDLKYGCALERPKVIYDEQQKLFIAYFKFYPQITGALKGYIGMATSKKPNAPFTYVGKFLGANSDNGSGDFSMFEDIDKSIYHCAVRKPDKVFVSGKLSANKLSPEGRYQPLNGITKHTEAPALFLHNKKYYLMGSGSSYWKPNKARLFVSDSLNGFFTDLGNPCVGRNPHNGISADTTFGGQINFILKVHGKKNAYIAMFDIWKQELAIEGLYMWLPITFVDGVPKIIWKNEWDLSVFNEKIN
jgi:Glycosyl hydrolases family 43